jgi:prepilin-type N-terminal cleavage/methylation domain-containing protein
MKKENGFSLIELLVVTGIVALLAVISLPNFSRMRSDINFKSESAIIFDQLLTVRMNALTGKMCGDESTERWIFLFNATASEISCKQSDGDIVSVKTYDTIWHDFHDIEIEEIVAGELVVLPKTEVQIEFLADTAQALIPDGTNQGLNAKIVLTSFAGDQKTICFDRIAGIPEISDGDIDCTP